MCYIRRRNSEQCYPSKLGLLLSPSPRDPDPNSHSHSDANSDPDANIVYAADHVRLAAGGGDAGAR